MQYHTQVLNATKVFFASFQTEPLYRSGFAYGVKDSGAETADCLDELCDALSYLIGYADACKLANPYGTPKYRLCGVMCGYSLLLRNSVRDLESVDLLRQIMPDWTNAIVAILREEDGT